MSALQVQYVPIILTTLTLKLMKNIRNSLIIGLVFCSCNVSTNIRTSYEKCSSYCNCDRLSVFVRENSKIDLIIRNDSIIKKINNKSVAVDYNFSLKKGDSIKLRINNKTILIKSFEFTYPSLEISTSPINSNVKLYYHCKKVYFD